jgi:hypothetical protein
MMKSRLAATATVLVAASTVLLAGAPAYATSGITADGDAVYFDAAGQEALFFATDPADQEPIVQQIGILLKTSHDQAETIFTTTRNSLLDNGNCSWQIRAYSVANSASVTCLGIWQPENGPTQR